MAFKNWFNKRRSDPADGTARATSWPVTTKQTVRQETITLPAGDPEQAQALIDSLVRSAEAQGAHVTTDISHDATQPVPMRDMQRATARVLAVQEITVVQGTPGAGAAGTVDLTLDVTPGAGEGWTTTTRLSFDTPEKRARVAAVGAELPVFVDPQAHDRIAIDTSAFG